MLNAKKIDFKTIALIVVSTLLVVSLTLAGTMAWFTAQDDAAGDLNMGQAIDMSIETISEGEFEIVVDGGQLLPGMRFAPNLSINVAAPAAGQTTAALLRATFTVSVDGSDESAEATALLSAFQARVTAATGWVYNSSDEQFYYIGKTDDESAYVMRTTAEGIAVTATGVSGTGAAVNGNTAGALYVPAVTRTAETTLANTVLASVIPASGVTANIVFMNPASQWIRIPTEWTDNLAGKTVVITFNVEAIQDYLVADNSAENDLGPTISAMKTALGDI